MKKLAKKIKALSDVDNNMQVFYEDDGEGGYVLKSDAITSAAVAVITGQQNALERARQDAKAAKEAGSVDLTALADYGTDPESIAANVAAKIEELSTAQSQGQREVAKRIHDIKRQHSEALAAATASKDQEIAATKATLNDYMLDTSILGAAGTWQGLNPKLVAPFARGHMQVQEVDGKPRPVVIDSDGQPRYSKNPDRAGELMNAAELLVEMSEQDDYKQLFPSQQASRGGGALEQKTPIGPRRTDNTKSMSAADKITAGLAERK
jgi:hypothetical protein